MNKWIVFIIGLLLGIIVCIYGNSVIEDNKMAIVYEVKNEIHLKNGMIIPKGIYLMRKSSMPEGYDILDFNITIMRGNIDNFFIERKKAINIQPYYLLDKGQLNQ